jgi:hypothetical protein
VSGKGKLLVIALIAAVLLSAFGLLRLFALRFERGDVFPPYSSLRSDPLGCKALFLALERTPGLDVRRNYRDPEKLKGSQAGTIYILGAGGGVLEHPRDREAKKLEALAGEGNRLVIAFGKVGEEGDAAGETADESDVGEKGTKEALPAKPCPKRGGAWGLEIGAFDPPAGPLKGSPSATATAPVSGLPTTIPLNSRRHFKGEGKGWIAVYSYGGRAVVLERNIGRGSIVLLAESYLLSNEALRKDRCPGLLAWLQGAGRTALFDESHLGVRDNPGIMMLIRKHRLVPFLVALLATALLYVWKCGVPFVGVPLPEKEYREVCGRDSVSGLVNLLRRNVPREELIGACFREWAKTFSRELGQSPELAGKLRKIIADGRGGQAGKGDPVMVYGKISDLLSEFRMRWR